jgi:hypothetical protein
MDHVKGINWEIIHELLLAEIKRVSADTNLAERDNSAWIWELDELNRMNDIAVKEAEKQS